MFVIDCASWDMGYEVCDKFSNACLKEKVM